MTVHVDLAVCARCGHLRDQHYYDGASMTAGGGPECAVHEDRGWWRRPQPCGCHRFLEDAVAVPRARLVEMLDALGMARTRDWDDALNAARCLRKQHDNALKEA